MQKAHSGEPGGLFTLLLSACLSLLLQQHALHPVERAGDFQKFLGGNLTDHLTGLRVGDSDYGLA